MPNTYDRLPAQPDTIPANPLTGSSDQPGNGVQSNHQFNEPRPMSDEEDAD